MPAAPTSTCADRRLSGVGLARVLAEGKAAAILPGGPRKPMQGFATTRWSLILKSGPGPEPAREALAYICSDYRAPVLAFVRRAGYSAADAEDLTQEFFARLLERHWHERADPALGRFRNYLLTALRRFLSDARSGASARKRGGGEAHLDFEQACDRQSQSTFESPEQAFTRSWMRTVLEHALRRLRAEAQEAGKLEQFERVAGFLAEPPDASVYAALGAELGMRPNTLAVHVHRLRQRLRSLVRLELLQTVADPESLEAELRELRASFDLNEAGA
jgi:RNA polymerase sigma factor (sigma-70 family)